MWKCHTSNRQLPVPDEDSQIFWAGCWRQRLLMQQCDSCGAFRFPPSPLCPACLATLATWREDPGDGEVVTFCVYHAALAGPAWQTSLPYVIVVVHLDYSGMHMLSQLVGSELHEVHIGLKVRLGFHVVQEGLALPQFFPRSMARAPPHVVP